MEGIVKKIKILLIFFVCIIILCIAYIYLSACFAPPYYEDKTVIDIWNNTNREQSGLMLSYEDSNITKTIPSIQPYERIVIVLDTSNMESAKTHLYISYNNHKQILIDDLRKNVGTEAIVSIHKNSFSTEDLSYVWGRHYRRLYYKNYDRLINL